MNKLMVFLWIVENISRKDGTGLYSKFSEAKFFVVVLPLAMQER